VLKAAPAFDLAAWNTMPDQPQQPQSLMKTVAFVAALVVLWLLIARYLLPLAGVST